MPTFATPYPIAATVQVAGAQVRVTATDRTDTTVLVKPMNEANPADVRVADKTRVDFARGHLSVKTTVPGGKDGSVAITIGLPAGSSLVAYLAHSTVHTDGVLSECELHMASGRAQLDRVDALDATIAAGEASVERIAGRAIIDGGTMAVRIGEVRGAARIASSAGQIWIGHAAADLDVRSGSGAFEVERADGSVTARTGNGDVIIRRAAG